ncbi:MAG: hypothetical protein ACOX0V_05325 [Bacteroidales bacterium]|jgi:glucosamine kinase|nr:hypothetical protein [Bacteroidales bacterium]NLP19455.1 hypothetical protein [Bacteroidales bacterium]
MYLFADSGSTKTHWVITDFEYNILTEFKTIGLNPYFTSEQKLLATLTEAFPQKLDPLKIEKLYFYGSGCSIEENYYHFRQAFLDFFFNAEINIFSDMLGAARASLKTDEGICAILGTGVNSCFYNGQAIKQNAISLGYILGDEGSGAYIGKLFAKFYLEKRLDPELSDKFYLETGENKASILNAVYKNPNPNKYLANFCHFIYKNIEHKQLTELVEFSFNKFFKNYIVIFNDYENKKLSLTGSLANAFKDILIKTAENFETQKPIFIDNPIYGIIEYHKITKE